MSSNATPNLSIERCARSCSGNVQSFDYDSHPGEFKFIPRDGGIVTAFTDFHEVPSLHAPVNALMNRSEMVVGQEIWIQDVRYLAQEVLTVVLPETQPNYGSGGVSSSAKGAISVQCGNPVLPRFR